MHESGQNKPNQHHRKNRAADDQFTDSGIPRPKRRNQRPQQCEPTETPYDKRQGKLASINAVKHKMNSREKPFSSQSAGLRLVGTSSKFVATRGCANPHF